MPVRPPILYKYLDAAGARGFLEKPQVRFKDFRKLDDLMEVLPGGRLMTEEELQRAARDKFERVAGKISEEKCAHFVRTLNEVCTSAYWEREVRKLVDSQTISICISSMSERCDSGAMWAGYAGEHSGIVFGLSAAIDRLRGAIAFLNPVVYSDVRPQNPFPILLKEVFLQAILTKSPDWDYQREWRLIAATEHVEILQPGDVTEVIVGYKASDDIQNLTLGLKAHGTRVFRARPDPARHSITRDEL
jgi:Protein of unknown function (DUF2971)